MWTYTDETGVEYEFNYIVTQTEAEGPEYMVYREKGKHKDPGYGWVKAPAWVEPPPGFKEHFFGPMHYSDNLPSIFEVFSTIRGVAQEMKHHAEHHVLPPNDSQLNDWASDLLGVGDYDEPLTGMINDLLADPNNINRPILERIAKP